MKNNFDYQWPQCFLKEHSFSLNDSKKSTTKLITFIENFFYDKFKSTVIVFPSARSCIGAILEFEKLNRNDEVYVSKWVSNCIFGSIGFYSNPTVNFIKPRMVLANNNWGLIQKFNFSLKKNRIIIDDSCDSLINDNKDLYPNKSKYEIFSLPKLIGSIAGGLLNKARNGDLGAQVFFLKTQGGWKDTTAVEHTSPDGSMTPTKIERIIVDPTD